MELKYKLRFEDRIYKSIDGCWYWLGTVIPMGYGYFCMNGKQQYAHRVSYQLYHGEIGSLHVLHKCDNTMCVNPDHLFLGTAQDNVKDKMNKGRGFVPYGDKHYLKKFDQEIIEELRRLHSKIKMPYAIYSRIYGIPEKYISSILNGKRRSKIKLTIPTKKTKWFHN